MHLYEASPLYRIGVIEAGVPASKAELLITEFHLDQQIMPDALNLKVAAVSKKAPAASPCRSRTASAGSGWPVSRDSLRQ